MLLAVTAARVYMGTLKEEKAISMMNRIKLIAKAELVLYIPFNSSLKQSTVGLHFLRQGTRLKF